MKYLISVGHTASGNVGCGAVGYLNESNCTREIVPLIVSKLKSLGHEAIKLQIDNSDSHDYVKRANQANSIGGDMFIEIHLNAGGGTGCEALTTPNSSASNVAYNISKAISNSLGITNRGHKTTTGLYVLNHTSMPAVLVEVCFVDNKTDYNAYNADKIATAIVSGLTGKEVKSQPKGEWLKGKSKGNEDKWWYKHSDGSYTINNWELIDGKYYFFDEKGWMRTGWIESPYSHKWFYCYSNGEMAHDCEMYGYRFDSDGVATKIQ